MAAGLVVVMPDGVDAPPPVLYLLHGLGDDETAWLRHTTVEDLATRHGIAVVLPRLQRSFGVDEPHGARFFTYLADELPGLVRSLFVVSGRREDTFVAGLSMGGYAAMLLALSRPATYAAAASLSGALDLVERNDDRTLPAELRHRLFDDRAAAGGPWDLDALLARAALPRPALFVGCGTADDGKIDASRSFAARAASAGYEVTTRFGPGDHDWPYWQAAAPDMFTFLRRPA